MESFLIDALETRIAGFLEKLCIENPETIDAACIIKALKTLEELGASSGQ